MIWRRLHIAFLRHRLYRADETIARLQDTEMDWEKTIINMCLDLAACFWCSRSVYRYL
jgi:hypothetical protein